MDLSHHMLLDLYGTAECDRRWTPLLDQLCADLGVRSAAVQVLEHRDDHLHERWTARDTGSLAHAALHDRHVNQPDNPRFDPAIRARDAREIGSDLRLFNANEPLLGKLRAQLHRGGLGNAIWAGFPIDNRQNFTLILHRAPDDIRDIDETEERFLYTLLPHLKQAVRLNRQIAQSRQHEQGFAAVLEQLRAGIILCTGDLGVAWYNQAAARVLQVAPALRVSGGQLWCPSQHDGQRLRALAAAVATGRQAVGTIALEAGGDEPVHVRIMRIAEDDQPSCWHGAEASLALVLSHAATLPRPDAAEIAALFSLTPAEARVAAALAAGTSLADFAAERRITVGTARIQLKQVLAKTASGRQAELVRQLCGSVAAYMTAP